MDEINKMIERYGITEYGITSWQSDFPLQNCRAKIRLPEESKSVIVCAFPYYVGEQENRNISKYAIVEDYHIVAENILKQITIDLEQQFQHRFVPFVDNSPLAEVRYAKKVGLGFIGKNHLLITKRYGSYVFLGTIVTDMVLQESQENMEVCRGCNQCIQNCPGGAILADQIKLESCVSHISQKKGDLTETEKMLLKNGGLLWGCDVCQDSCPHNQKIEQSNLSAFQHNIVANVEYHRIEEYIKTRAFGFRGAAVIRRNYGILYDIP